MILPDTSVWIDHFRSINIRLVAMLSEKRIVTHSLVIGELACGAIPDRLRTLNNLKSLHRVAKAADRRVESFIENYKLWDRGLSIVDVHLLVAASNANVSLWTYDKRLRRAAEKLEITFAE